MFLVITLFAPVYFKCKTDNKIQKWIPTVKLGQEWVIPDISYDIIEADGITTKYVFNGFKVVYITTKSNKVETVSLK